MYISYVNIFVSDLERAVAFYQSCLGLKPECNSAEHSYASFSAGAVRLGLVVPGPDHRELIGRHTGVGLAVADLDAEYARLSSRGVVFKMPPARQPWGGFMALIADPDDNVFYLDQVSAAHRDEHAPPAA
jgi:predicted enzyme related to lactoylglutathione lyase